MGRAFSPSLHDRTPNLGRCPRLLWRRAFGALSLLLNPIRAIRGIRGKIENPPPT